MHVADKPLFSYLIRSPLPTQHGSEGIPEGSGLPCRQCGWAFRDGQVQNTPRGPAQHRQGNRTATALLAGVRPAVRGTSLNEKSFARSTLVHDAAFRPCVALTVQASEKIAHRNEGNVPPVPTKNLIPLEF